MRSTFYAVLSALPSKIFSGLAVVVGAATQLFPEQSKAWLAWIMTPDQIRFWGLVALTAVAAYWIILWLLKPPLTESRQIGSSENSTYGDGSHIFAGHVEHVGDHYHSSPSKFSAECEIFVAPPFLGGANTINLDNTATLRLYVPYSDSGVTLVLDAPSIALQPSVTEGLEVDGTQMHFGTKTFWFDVKSAQRHSIDVGGRFFVVTLSAIDPTPVTGIAGAIRYKFMISER